MSGEIELTLLPAPEDGAPDSAELQTALWAADRDLRARGAKSNSTVFVQDDAEAIMTHLGKMVVQIAPVAFPAIGLVAAAWLQGRSGRKVRLKYRDALGDVEVEARTTEEAEQLLSKIPRDRVSPPKESDKP